jgi:lipopolysaccharide biosynthesis glycosyltransferase
MSLANTHSPPMRAKIFVTYHKETHLVNGGILEPIQVGKGPALPGCTYRDDTGRNIADRNDRYCEMTAAYWVWQNCSDQEAIGLLHYRRFLDFSGNPSDLDEWGVVNVKTFTTDFVRRFGLDDATITGVIGSADIVLPRQWSVRKAGFRTLHEHYAKAPYHHEADLIRCLDLIRESCPDYVDSWHEVMQGESGWFNNMFVMRSEIFQQYCHWVFPLLEELEKRIPLQHYGTQERRVLGYLAERLLNVWLRRHLELHPKTSIRELDRVFVNDPAPKLWDPPRLSDSGQTISIVMASDNAYVPHLGAFIVSLFDNLTPKGCVELLVLDGGISAPNQAMLKRLIPAGSCLHFLPMEEEFTAYFTHMHFSRATFYRLALGRILKGRDKVLYIDCDTIVLGDVNELWALDMKDKPIAAAHDYIMESFCRTQTLSADFTGSLPARTYLERYLGISPDQCERYFQAGVLLMNLRRIRELGVTDNMIESLETRKYWFLDQDVLNKYFCGSHANLPAEWNVINMIDDISHGLDTVRAEELKQARLNAKLIHYAGYEAKPWVNPNAPLAHYYFQYLRRTFWYEEVIGLWVTAVETARGQEKPSSQQGRWWQRLRKLWRRMPVRVRQIANPAAYAIRRRVLGG